MRAGFTPTCPVGGARTVVPRIDGVTNPDATSSLPAAWNPADHEQGLYRGWVEAGYFTADADSDKPPFSIVIPPPNVNGSLHMGTPTNTS